MEYTINGKTVSRELHEAYDMACHNLLAYSANYAMTAPKDGFSVEHAAARLEVERLATLAAGVVVSFEETATELPDGYHHCRICGHAVFGLHAHTISGPTIAPVETPEHDRRQFSPALTPARPAGYAVAVEIETAHYRKNVAMSDAFIDSPAYGAASWCRYHMVQAAESLQRLQAWAADPAAFDFSEFSDVCEVTA